MSAPCLQRIDCCWVSPKCGPPHSSKCPGSVYRRPMGKIGATSKSYGKPCGHSRSQQNAAQLRKHQCPHHAPARAAQRHIMPFSLSSTRHRFSVMTSNQKTNLTVTAWWDTNPSLTPTATRLLALASRRCCFDQQHTTSSTCPFGSVLTRSLSNKGNCSVVACCCCCSMEQGTQDDEGRLVRV